MTSFLLVEADCTVESKQQWLLSWKPGAHRQSSAFLKNLYHSVNILNEQTMKV